METLITPWRNKLLFQIYSLGHVSYERNIFFEKYFLKISFNQQMEHDFSAFGWKLFSFNLFLLSKQDFIINL